MLKEVKTGLFEKDIKKLLKKHYNFSSLYKVIEIIRSGGLLPSKYKNHYLKDNLQGYQECHVDNDILLIYQIIDDKLYLCRVGSHRDLLNK